MAYKTKEENTKKSSQIKKIKEMLVAYYDDVARK